MPLFGQKSQFYQNNTILWAKKPKESVGCPFFPIFHEKIALLMLIFNQKYVYFLKKTLLSSPYFLKKRSFSQNYCALILRFFKFFMKNLLLSSPYLVKKRQFYQNYTIFWVLKVDRMPFFSDFSRKSNYSHAHILSKNARSLKNTPFSFHEKLPTFIPYLVKNRQFCQTTLYYGPKQSIGSGLPIA